MTRRGDKTRDETNLHSGGGGHVVVAVHEDLRLNDGHKPGLLHGARVTCESPRVLLNRADKKSAREKGGSRAGQHHNRRGERKRVRSAKIHAGAMPNKSRMVFTVAERISGGTLAGDSTCAPVRGKLWYVRPNTEKPSQITGAK